VPQNLDSVNAPALAFWITAPGEGEIRSAPITAPGPGEALVRTRYSAVSRGTESLVFQGRAPPSQYHAMRAPFQEGEFPAPVKYGYCNVGEVVDGPADWLGRTVFCLYPHQSFYRVPVSTLTAVPAAVPAARAVLAANMETAVNALWDLAPLVGERIAVIGAGVVGCLCVRLLAGIPGVSVTMVDHNPQRKPLARQLGADFATPAQVSGVFDRLVHASGNPAGLRLALALAAMEATILELSWYGDQAVELPLGEHFHPRRLTLRSSQVGNLNPAQQPRWDHARRLALALRLLDDARLDALIDGESAFEDLPTTLPRLVAMSGQVLCHRLRYP